MEHEDDFHLDIVIAVLLQYRVCDRIFKIISQILLQSLVFIVGYINQVTERHLRHDFLTDLIPNLVAVQLHLQDMGLAMPLLKRVRTAFLLELAVNHDSDIIANAFSFVYSLSGQDYGMIP